MIAFSHRDAQNMAGLGALIAKSKGSMTSIWVAGNRETWVLFPGRAIHYRSVGAESVTSMEGLQGYPWLETLNEDEVRE
jgi:hypothetical protein